jgi:hypothetical protein
VSDTDERRLDAQITQAQTPEHIRTDGVIRSTKEEALWEKMNARHILGKHESATDLMCITDADKAKSKLEIYDPKAEAKGPSVIEKAATQAMEQIPPVPDWIKNAPDASPVVLNIQITNVPEVSKGVAPQQWMQHLDTTFAAGAQAVKPIEQWMATPNAVNNALVGVGQALDNAVNYYADTPVDQVASDVHDALSSAGDVLDRTFSFAHTSKERAKTAGDIMPLVFTDGLGTTGESATLKTADAVATHVDAAVMQTIEKSLDAIKTAPDLAADIKQGLFEFLKGQELTAQQAEAAGIPRGFFDDIPHGAAKDDNFFAMSKADNPAEGIPSHNESKLERKPVTEKLPPSEQFVTELSRIVDGLPEDERAFLRQHGIEVKAVRRITDVPEVTDKLGGCYLRADNAIYIPEEVFRSGQWVKNNDIPFILRHEYGHALNAKAHPFGDPLSDKREFIEAFNRDFDVLPLQLKETLQLSQKFKTVNAARDEVFADLWAHSTGTSSNNPYSQLMKQKFPSVLEFFMERK